MSGKYSEQDIVSAIELCKTYNSEKQYKKTVKKLKNLLNKAQISSEEQQIHVLQLLLEAYIESENIDDENFYQTLTTLIQLDPESKLSSNEKFFIFGQLIGGESGVQSYEKGIANIQSKGENSKEDNAKIISGYLAICEIFMTDLCMLSEAESECERYLKECLKIDENDAAVWLQYGSFKISQQRFDEALQCFEKSWTLFTSKQEVDSLSGLQFSYNLIKFLMELGQLSFSEEILNESKKYEDDNIEGLYLEGFLHYLFLKVKSFNLAQGLDINSTYTPNQFMNNDLNATILDTALDLNNALLHEHLVDAKIALSYLLLLAENSNEIGEMGQEYIDGSNTLLVNELGGAVERQELINLKKGDFIKDAEDVDLETEIINN